MKALAHLVPQSSEADAFGRRVEELAQTLREQPDAAGVQVNVMLRPSDDPFGPRTPYRAALELTGEDASAIEACASRLAQGLEGIALRERSTLLLGEDAVFIASERTPIRYQYLMRRNAQFSHASYLERYREIHSQFGLKTPGILGYVQFHVDAEASERVARRCGMGVWDVDSVSELHLDSVERFLDEVSRSSIGREAMEDEELFVDRARSHDFCSAVHWHP
jgi:hypothetical protein